MDFQEIVEAYVTSSAKFSDPYAALAEIRGDVQRLHKYDHIYVAEWVGDERVPIGAKLGDKTVVGATHWYLDGVAVDADNKKSVGAFAMLFDDPQSAEDVRKVKQRYVMLIGTNEVVATDANGVQYPEVKREVLAWSGVPTRAFQLQQSAYFDPRFG